jgi:tRNA(Ile)-lysidine synthetase-like protein
VSIIVSLSGGVDSMVIARVLAHLRLHCGYDQLHIVAAHIDYANRPESIAEALYVQKFCSYHSIEYHCRRIDEVTRGITSRDDYEKISRDIRYQFYRDLIQQCHTTTNTTAATTKSSDNGNSHKHIVGVMLGHHRGDLRENVLSNSHKGCGPLDLSGMTSVSKNDGVILYRPLLPLEKSVVYEYAHSYGVPYFKDTTPHWSTRGKLRNKLLPLLEEIYGEGSMKNLSNLAVESDECKDLLDKVLIGPFMKQIKYKPLGILFDTNEWHDKCLYFWKVVLRDTLHSAKLGMFTDKSVESYVQRINHVSSLGKNRQHVVTDGWLQCRKDYSVFLRHDGRTYVLYPSSFPWHKSDYYDCSTLGPVPIPLYKDSITTTLSSSIDARTTQELSEVVVGPWHVSVENLGPILEDTDRKELLNRKAFKDMDDFMNGYIEYYLEAPSWYKKKDSSTKAPPNTSSALSFICRPLIFTRFTKATRPSSWKNLDAKIQDTLPLLGNDMDALHALQDPFGCDAVHTIQQRNGDHSIAEDDANDSLTMIKKINPVYVIKVVLKVLCTKK